MRIFSTIFSAIQITVVLFGCFVNCNYSKVETKTVNLKSNEIISEPQQESKIIGSEEDMWQSSFSNIGRNEYLEYIQAFNETDFYVLGEYQNLYITKNAGKTWKSIKIAVPTDTIISSISFFNHSHGLVSVVKSPKDILDTKSFQSWILETKDGGLTWSNKFEIKSAEIRKVVFDTQEKGWAVGRKLIKDKYIENLSLIITTNTDNQWQEINSPLDFGSIENIFIAKNLTKILIDTKGQVFELNSEMEWKARDSIENIKHPQIGISIIGSTEDKNIYLMGATGGREGSWTSLFSKDNSFGKWQHYQINNVQLLDAVFLSSNEILATGSLIEFDKPEIKQGVVLHSFDSGKTWLISLKKSNSHFSRILNDDENNIWIIGTKGIFVHLEKTNHK